jgi:hypothetical protein
MNPRAAAATAANTPIAFNTLTDNPYQPLTSHLLRTESGTPCSRVPLMERTPPVPLQIRGPRCAAIHAWKTRLRQIRPFQNEIMLTK